jgi:hypothetical protein
MLTSAIASAKLFLNRTASPQPNTATGLPYTRSSRGVCVGGGGLALTWYPYSVPVLSISEKHTMATYMVMQQRSGTRSWQRCTCGAAHLQVELSHTSIVQQVVPHRPRTLLGSVRVPGGNA